MSVHGLTECAVTLTSEVADLLCYGERKFLNMEYRASCGYGRVGCRDEGDRNGYSTPIREAQSEVQQGISHSTY